jgi:hypothetical protein
MAALRNNRVISHKFNFRHNLFLSSKFSVKHQILLVHVYININLSDMKVFFEGTVHIRLFIYNS